MNKITCFWPCYVLGLFALTSPALSAESIPAQKNIWDNSGAKFCQKVGDRAYDSATDSCTPPTEQAQCTRLGGTWDATTKCSMGGSGGATLEQVCQMIGGRFVPKNGDVEASCQTGEEIAGTLNFNESTNWFQHNVSTRFFRNSLGKLGFYFWDREWGGNIPSKAKRAMLTNFDPENENSYRGSITYNGTEGNVKLDYCIPSSKVLSPRVYVIQAATYRGHGWDRDFSRKVISACVDHGHSNGRGRVTVAGRHLFGLPKDCSDFNMFEDQFLGLSCDNPNCS